MPELERLPLRKKGAKEDAPGGVAASARVHPVCPPGARSFIVTDDFLVQSFITG